MSLRYDLHSHTTVSDGILQPKALVAAAARAGVEVFAITDHDTVGAIPDALEAADEAGLCLVPGIEISAHHGERELHLLVYYSPERLGEWDRFQAQRQAAREGRFHQMLERCAELGLALPREEILEERREAGVFGRPHLARALVAAGHVESMEEAFNTYLGTGKPVHVDTRGPSAAEAIELAASLGGVSVVAHPVYGDLDEVLPELADLGLSGVEAYHYSHNAETAAHFAGRARELGLLTTGGSDYHGESDDPRGERSGERLGTISLPPEAAEAFREALVASSGWGPPPAP